MRQRIYNCKDEDLLIVLLTIAKSFQNNIAKLQVFRPSWTAETATALVTSIQDAISEVLGLNKKSSLRKATQTLLEIIEPLYRKLSFLKIQVEVDIPAKADQILDDLGYRNFVRASKGDQEAIINLSAKFIKNMTDDLKKQITDAGTNPLLIDEIIALAKQVAEAEALQEELKGSSQQLSEDAVEKLNLLYTDIIGICKIVNRFYYDDEAIKTQFTFTKVLDRLNHTKKKEEEKETTTA
ncbi:MAG: hypothetical protein MI739_00945 [Bacteroidales bacterium]|nr:hypothetical protein [Bacteroidales bacterium]